MSIPSAKEIARRGQERYEREIRSIVEADAGNRGKMLALDIDSGEYELADDSLTALNRLKVTHPDASTYILRVGYPAAVRIGSVGQLGEAPGRTPERT
jgi:hypothetical protein